jgi:methylmalonyl-CoA mutase
MESLTASVASAAREIIREVEGLGGMTKAIVQGMPKLRIEECAARRQARVDRGDDVIVGVNKYQIDEETEIEVLDVDNEAVRAAQIARLEQIRASRDGDAVDAALAQLQEVARSGEGNLLEAAVEAARRRATIGEISDALEQEFTRYRADVQSISGVYGGVYAGDEAFDSVLREVVQFAEDEGRRPRMLVVKLGQDGHDRGMKVIATAFADLGFDVDVGPLFQVPAEAARMAVENDVHVIGVSSQAAGHKTLVPELVKELAAQGADNIVVVVGGIIPPKDYDFLREKGVAAIFGPGTAIPKAAREVLQVIRSRAA